MHQTADGGARGILHPQSTPLPTDLITDNLQVILAQPRPFCGIVQLEHIETRLQIRISPTRVTLHIASEAVDLRRRSNLVELTSLAQRRPMLLSLGNLRPQADGPSLNLGLRFLNELSFFLGDPLRLRKTSGLH